MKLVSTSSVQEEPTDDANVSDHVMEFLFSFIEPQAHSTRPRAMYDSCGAERFLEASRTKVPLLASASSDEGNRVFNTR